MAVSVKITGLKELEKALLGIEKHTTRRSLARRVLKKNAQPIADTMNQLAPDDPKTQGGLHTDYTVSTKLNKTQRRKARKNKADVEVYAGTDNPAGVQQEFGNKNHAAQPHVRPAWDQHKVSVLKNTQSDMRDEIVKAAKRQMKRKAKGA